MSSYNRVMTLFEQIKQAQQEVFKAKQRLARLERAQIDCTHDYYPLEEGFEFEGRFCKQCGVNELDLPAMEHQRTVVAGIVDALRGKRV